MKNIITTLFIITLTLTLKAQTISLENSFQTEKRDVNFSLHKIQLATEKLLFKYDYRPNGSDVLGFIIPKFWKNENTDVNMMLVKSGNHNIDDRFALDIWVNKKFTNSSLMIDAGRLVSKNGKPWDFIGGKFSNKYFTVEAYTMAYHCIFSEKLNKDDPVYFWAGYHPEHSFFALGKGENDYWLFGGTRNLKNFGNFNLIKYNAETKNFWIKSQSAFGVINQNFFSLATYDIAAEYLVIPLFFHKHFSPICAKGSYALKFEGKRIGDIHNYELMAAKSLPTSSLGIALGVNSEYYNAWKLAPSAEICKTWKIGDYNGVIELRYDMVYESLIGYLVLKY